MTNVESNPNDPITKSKTPARRSFGHWPFNHSSLIRHSSFVIRHFSSPCLRVSVVTLAVLLAAGTAHAADSFFYDGFRYEATVNGLKDGALSATLTKRLTPHLTLRPRRGRDRPRRPRRTCARREDGD